MVLGSPVVPLVRIFPLLAGLALLGGAAGCSRAPSGEELGASDKFARSAIEALRTNGLPGLLPHLTDETARVPQLQEEVDKMRNALPPGAPDTIQLIASEVEFSRGRTTTKLQYLIQTGPRTAEAEVWVEGEGDSRAVETLRITSGQ